MTDRTQRQHLAELESMVSAFGVVSTVSPVKYPELPPNVDIFHSVPGSGIPGRGSPDHDDCFGRAFNNSSHARLVAIAEAAERYAAGAFSFETVIEGIAAELPGPTIQLCDIPRCSESEYRQPDCPLVAFDATRPIRWVKGADLATGEDRWLPLVMATYRTVPRPEEKFVFRVSTGFAVHTDPLEAVFRGLCEVAERDAIALTWLQRLPLPTARLTASAQLSGMLSWCEQHFLEVTLFDATTDVEVPTVYLIMVAPHDHSLRNIIGCGTGRNLSEAAANALGETILLRSAMASTPEVGEIKEIRRLADSAKYMAHADRSTAFDFLTRDGPGPVQKEPKALPQDTSLALRQIITRLTAIGTEVVVVDFTTDELRDVGLTAVNVVIPALQPMSLLPGAQFRSHRRLYRAPAAMGMRTLPEADLNPWPQPFA